MLYDDFETFLSDLVEYFGYKQIYSPEKKQRWFERIKHIPEEALEHIKGLIFDNQASLPRNIPMHMKSNYIDWKRLNPGKIMKEQAERCDDCGSTGFLWYTEKIDGLVYEKMAVCAACDNWKIAFGFKAKERHPVRIKKDLIEQGYAVKEIKNFEGNDTIPPSWVGLRASRLSQAKGF